MSRRPTTTRGTISRTASSASMAMPPPSRIPNRPPSVASNIHKSQSQPANRQGQDDGTGSESRPSSPSRRARFPSGQSVKGKEGARSEGNGEINIQVVVRLRGRSPQEVASASPIITTTSGAVSKAITIETTPLPSSSLASFTTASSYGGPQQPSTKTYPFDKVFGPEADQTMIFNEVADGMLDEVLAGYNCTIFAYGQTGTGKTYTMQGDLELTNLDAPKSTAGIVPRVLHRLFTVLEATPNTEFSVKCSYVELYNEELRDLLATEYKGDFASANAKEVGGLKLYEDGKKGVMIQGLEEVGVRSLKEALNTVDKGVKRRQTAETKMNTESSRSHTIFSVTVHVRETNVHGGREDLLRIGKFNLVDLAGSEAIGRSGATDKRAREAGMINQSLLTLGRVISALVEKGSHIPYRESKLTRLLQDSLGGRTKTCIVATVSPTRSNMEETLSTLDYAIRAKSIRNRPEVNAHMTKTGLLKEYVGDIERLKAELMASREKNGIYIPEDQWKEMQEAQLRQKSDYDEARQKAGVIEVELETKKKEFDQVSVRFLATTEELAQVREAERQLTEMLEETKVVLDRVKVDLEEEAVISKAYKKGEDRLDAVAGGLKKVATESVADVGGLFDKLARKAKVLGSNSDAATTFGGSLKSLSENLKTGLAQLHSAHDDFSQGVKSELEEYATKGQQTSQADQRALDKSFSIFNDLAKRLSASNEKGQKEAAEASKAILAVKEEVQASVRQWASGVSERSEKMVGDLLEHQQEHLDTVGSVLGSTADLVDAVISTTLAHLSSEADSARKTRDSALQASSSEINRLQSQNALLFRLLAEEREKTAKLRTELIGNFTRMIAGFTDAQEHSLTTMMDKVKIENESAVEEMRAFGEDVGRDWEIGENRRTTMRDELEMGGETARRQRSAGQEALSNVREGPKERLEVYGQETANEAQSHVEVVDGFCAQIGKSATEVSSKSTYRSKKQADYIAAISSSVGQTHQASKKRFEEVADGIAFMSSGLMASQSHASSSFTQAYSNSTTTLDGLMQSTAAFLSSGIQEDVPTGITPKKKVWNVPTEWQRTGSREAVLANWRRRVEAGEVSMEEAALGVEGEDESEGDHLAQDEEHHERGEIDSVDMDGPLRGSVRSDTGTQEAMSASSSSSSNIQSRESTPISSLPTAQDQPPAQQQQQPQPTAAPPSGVPVMSASDLRTSVNGRGATHGRSLSIQGGQNGTSLRVPSGMEVRKVKNSLSNATVVGGGKKSGFGFGGAEERPQMTVLGEGVGVNVPRRSARR
ncbi:kinesin family member 11 [Kwoniella heveanensis BCC8398]|uniref:Kinesin family member 11 n=1 Tax=Kwoniella heveanensis BCC8398 TaxID=1296120 RepID=A0A1B9GXL3_9TREE|nr:kinesin family member 11 [Kwoniella heveanensis BCC8398]